MSETASEPEDGASERARTVVGQFLAHSGIIIIKETREIGALKCEQGRKVAAETLTLATARGSKTMLGKTFGIRLEATDGDGGGARSAVLDYVETGEFCDALQFLHEAALRLAPLKTDHTEATFSTRDLIKVGFYQSTDQQQLAFVQLGGGDPCFFQVASLPSFRRLIEAARSYLVLKGAGGPSADQAGDRAG